MAQCSAAVTAESWQHYWGVSILPGVACVCGMSVCFHYIQEGFGFAYIMNSFGATDRRRMLGRRWDGGRMLPSKLASVGFKNVERQGQGSSAARKMLEDAAWREGVKTTH